MIPGGPIVQLAVVVATIGGLWIGARLLVDAAVTLARGAGLSELVIGLTIVAAGTSAPELAVSVDAASKGLGDLALANLLGSNVYNLAAILGVVALVRAVPIARSLVRRDGLALVGSSLVVAVVLADRAVTRLEGAVLVVAFVGYTAYLLRTGRTFGDAPAASPAPATSAAPTTSATSATSAASVTSAGPATSAAPAASATTRVADRLDRRWLTVLALVAGLALVVVSGDLLIGATTELARAAGVSEWVIGGTIVAAGTSTPELAVSLIAIRRGSTGVSVGNVVGSNVFNVVGIVGIAALVRPLTVGGDVFVTLAWLIAISLAVTVLLWTDRVLSRLEGLLLVASELVRWSLNLLA